MTWTRIVLSPFPTRVFGILYFIIRLVHHKRARRAPPTRPTEYFDSTSYTIQYPFTARRAAALRRGTDVVILSTQQLIRINLFTYTHIRYTVNYNYCRSYINNLFYQTIGVYIYPSAVVIYIQSNP